eukprot:GEMP01000212.1.p1 GENE.GEMP01000212.1~~GEMP01000212.1.p1  ORF type:complete len:2586 (+),score=598.26 GEMP01000212.1:101-7858(+)
MPVMEGLELERVEVEAELVAKQEKIAHAHRLLNVLRERMEVEYKLKHIGDEYEVAKHHRSEAIRKAREQLKEATTAESLRANAQRKLTPNCRQQPRKCGSHSLITSPARQAPQRRPSDPETTHQRVRGSLQSAASQSTILSEEDENLTHPDEIYDRIMCNEIRRRARSIEGNALQKELAILRLNSEGLENKLASSVEEKGGLQEEKNELMEMLSKVREEIGTNSDSGKVLKKKLDSLERLLGARNRFGCWLCNGQVDSSSDDEQSILETDVAALKKENIKLKRVAEINHIVPAPHRKKTCSVRRAESGPSVLKRASADSNDKKKNAHVQFCSHFPPQNSPIPSDAANAFARHSTLSTLSIGECTAAPHAQPSPHTAPANAKHASVDDACTMVVDTEIDADATLRPVRARQATPFVSQKTINTIHKNALHTDDASPTMVNFDDNADVHARNADDQTVAMRPVRDRVHTPFFSEDVAAQMSHGGGGSNAQNSGCGVNFGAVVEEIPANASNSAALFGSSPIRRTRNRMATPFAFRGATKIVDGLEHDGDDPGGTASSFGVNFSDVVDFQTRECTGATLRPYRSRVRTPGCTNSIMNMIACAVDGDSAEGDVGDMRSGDARARKASPHGCVEKEVSISDKVIVETREIDPARVGFRPLRGRIATPFVSPQALQGMGGAATGSSNVSQIVDFDHNVNVEVYRVDGARGVLEVSGNAILRPARNRMATPFAHAADITGLTGSHYARSSLHAPRASSSSANVAFSESVETLVNKCGNAMRPARNRLLTPYIRHEHLPASIADTNTHGRVDFSDVVLVEERNTSGDNAPNPAGLRPVRNRIATPFFSSEIVGSWGEGNIQPQIQQPESGHSAVSSSDIIRSDTVDVTTIGAGVPSGDNNGTVRGAADPSLTRETMAPHAPLHPVRDVNVNFSNFEEVMEVDSNAADDRMSPALHPARQRIATPFISMTPLDLCKDEVDHAMGHSKVNFDDTVALSESQGLTADGISGPFRSSHGRIPTPHICKGTMSILHNRVEFCDEVDLFNTEVAESASGAPLRHTRSRMATPYLSIGFVASVTTDVVRQISRHAQSDDEDDLRDVQPSAVNFPEGAVEVELMETDHTGPMRESRNRIATPFIDQTALANGDLSAAGLLSGNSEKHDIGVDFSEIVDVQPGQSGHQTQRPVKNRIPTPFISQETIDHLAPVQGAKVDFDNVIATQKRESATLRDPRNRMVTPFLATEVLHYDIGTQRPAEKTAQQQPRSIVDFNHDVSVLQKFESLLTTSSVTCHPVRSRIATPFITPDFVTSFEQGMRNVIFQDAVHVDPRSDERGTDDRNTDHAEQGATCPTRNRIATPFISEDVIEAYEKGTPKVAFHDAVVVRARDDGKNGSSSPLADDAVFRSVRGRLATPTANFVSDILGAGDDSRRTESMNVDHAASGKESPALRSPVGNALEEASSREVTAQRGMAPGVHGVEEESITTLKRKGTEHIAARDENLERDASTDRKAFVAFNNDVLVLAQELPADAPDKLAKSRDRLETPFAGDVALSSLESKDKEDITRVSELSNTQRDARDRISTPYVVVKRKESVETQEVQSTVQFCDDPLVFEIALSSVPASALSKNTGTRSTGSNDSQCATTPRSDSTYRSPRPLAPRPSDKLNQQALDAFERKADGMTDRKLHQSLSHRIRAYSSESLPRSDISGVLRAQSEGKTMSRWDTDEDDCMSIASSSRTERHPDLCLCVRQVEDYTMIDADRQVILESLGTLEFCDGLDKRDLNALTDSMALYRFGTGELVCCEGDDTGSHFFILHSGELAFVQGNKVVNHFSKPGAAFGESVLFLHGVRKATVTAMCETFVWGIEGLHFRDVIKYMYVAKQAELCAVIEKEPILRRLPDREKDLFCEKACLESFLEDDVLVDATAASHARKLYFPLEGILAINDGPPSATAPDVKGYFGETSILYGYHRHSVVALTSGMVVSVTKEVAQDIFMDDLRHALSRNIVLNALQRSVFSKFTPGVREGLHEVMEIFSFNEKQANMDLPKDTRFVVVLLGEVTIGSGECVVSQGEFFGDEFVISPTKLFANGLPLRKGSPTVSIAVLRNPAMNKVLRYECVYDSLVYDEKIASVRGIFLFATLSEKHVDLLAQAFKPVVHKYGNRIVSQGLRGETFYVVREGSVLVKRDGKKIRTLGKSDYFGERALLYDECRSASVICESDVCELWILQKEVFQEILRGPVLQSLEDRIRLQDTRMQLTDLRALTVIGRGGFGIVKLVEHTSTKTRYALKVLDKAQIREHNQQERIRSERAILAELDHPFIARFVRTFKDEQKIYFLLELVTGGELLSALGTLGILNAKQTRFYIGCLILALELLHSRRIIYRDLKAENILLDKFGYIKLIDFGIAKKLQTVRTHTLIGTPQFMAPEVIRGKGYGLMADNWSLGVCLYEFMVGSLPFGCDKVDQWDIWQEILYLPLTFPVSFKHSAAKNLMKGLLEKKPTERSGSTILGFKPIKQSVFFDGFQWDHLLQRSVEPPLIPVPASYTYADGSDVSPINSGQIGGATPTSRVSLVAPDGLSLKFAAPTTSTVRRASWHLSPAENWDHEF